MSKILATQPKPAAVTGLTLESGVKSATLAWDLPFDSVGVSWEIMVNDVDDLSTAVLDGESSTTTYTTAVFGKAYFWVRSKSIYGTFNEYVGSLSNTPGLITSQDTASSPATAISSGVGGSVSSGTFNGANGVYVPVCSSSFVASENSYVTMSQLITLRIGAKSGSGGIEVWARTRLYDQTTGQDVPAGSKRYCLYKELLTVYGDKNQLFNVNENFISGFRGLIVSGHSYVLYTDLMRQQYAGTASIPIDYDSQTTAAGAASI